MNDLGTCALIGSDRYPSQSVALSISVFDVYVHESKVAALIRVSIQRTSNIARRMAGNLSRFWSCIPCSPLNAMYSQRINLFPLLMPQSKELNRVSSSYGVFVFFLPTLNFVNGLQVFQNTGPFCLLAKRRKKRVVSAE